MEFGKTLYIQNIVDFRKIMHLKYHGIWQTLCIHNIMELGKTLYIQNDMEFGKRYGFKISWYLAKHYAFQNIMDFG